MILKKFNKPYENHSKLLIIKLNLYYNIYLYSSSNGFRNLVIMSSLQIFMKHGVDE